MPFCVACGSELSGLKGFFSIEEQFDRDLSGYYDALQMNLHHNYYFGRNDPDLTPWLEFFLKEHGIPSL